MKNLTQGNIYKTFFLFSLPLICSGLLSTTYGIVNAAIAGKFLGEQGLGAIGATQPLISFLSAIFWGFGTGLSIYLAKLFGEKNYQRIKSTIYSNYALYALLCVSISILLIFFHNSIFDFLHIEESLRSDAFQYFFVYMIGFLLITLNANGVYVMNAFGIGFYPFLMSILSFALNIIGNIFTIIILDMGVIGSALSTLFSALLTDLLYIWKLKKCFKEMDVENDRGHISFAYVKAATSYIFPNTIQQLVMYFSSFLISPLVNNISISASASYSVISPLYDMNACVYQDSAKAVSNYSAQCVGEKKYNQIARGVKAGLLQGILFVTPFILVCSLFPEKIATIFFEQDASWETKHYVYRFARLCLPLLYLNLICNLFHALFKGVKASGHLLSATILASLSRYVFALLLIPKFGMDGFFYSWIFSWAIESVYVVLLFYIGRWKPKA